MRFCIFTLLSIVTLAVSAEVVRVDERSFISEHQLAMAAPPDAVWRALTRDIAQWWDPAHSYSGIATNFRLDARAGGCFCETLPDGSVEHMRVVFARTNQELRMTGGLGPLQSMGVAGAMTFALEETETGTRLDYKYAVTGAGGEALADAVDRVQLGQLQRLQRYLEQGDANEH
jgi:uncharacterized protein YndB with AHSA1/START domain